MKQSSILHQEMSGLEYFLNRIEIITQVLFTGSAFFPHLKNVYNVEIGNLLKQKSADFCIHFFKSQLMHKWQKIDDMVWNNNY